MNTDDPPVTSVVGFVWYTVSVPDVNIAARTSYVYVAAPGFSSTQFSVSGPFWLLVPDWLKDAIWVESRNNASKRSFVSVV